MNLNDLLYLCFQNIKARKSRIFFTSLGFSITIGTILFLVSLGYGLQKNILQRITSEVSLLTLDVVPSETKILPLNEESLKKNFSNRRRGKSFSHLKL